MPDSNSVWMTIDENYTNGTTTEYGQLITYGEKTKRLKLVDSDGSSEIKDICFTVKPENAEYTMLNPKIKLACRGLFVFMFLIPVLFAGVGVGLCGLWFYRKKIWISPFTMIVMMN